MKVTWCPNVTANAMASDRSGADVSSSLCVAIEVLLEKIQGTVLLSQTAGKD